MNQPVSSREFQADQPVDLFGIDVKRVLYRALRYWYLIIISLLLALTVAFVRNRYATRIYPVTASVIIKEQGDMSGAELLYSNPLVKFRRNYLNEIYIIKSYPLIQRVIEDLNFDISFYREGNIISTEAYEDFPVVAYANRAKATKSSRFAFKVLSDTHFELDATGDRLELGPKTFAFGDTIMFGDFTGIFLRQGSVQEILNQSQRFEYTPPTILAGRYESRLGASWAEEGAGVINLSISGANTTKAKDFLSGLITQYQNNDLENKNRTATRTVDFISDQLEVISDSLRRVELQLELFKSKNNGTDLSGEALRLYQKMEGLEVQKAQLIVNQNYYQYLSEYIQKDANLDQIILPTSMGISDPVLTSLITQMTQIQMEIKMSTRKENPLVLEATRSISEIKKDIIESVRNQKSVEQIKLDFLNKQTRDIERQLGSLPLAQRTLISIQRNYSLMENLYIYLLQKRSEAAISKASNTSDIITVNPPTSGAPTSPKASINYLIALISGLGFPLIIFVLLEVFNTRIQSKEDVEKFTDIPFIGGVGHKKTDNNLEVITHPKTAIAESFRALRSNLNYFVGEQEKAVFLITSSISGEGKTFTSINLASVLAMSGKRTLIVGADMRRPKLFNDFGLGNEVGLSTYLAGLNTFDQIVKRTPYDNLDLVSGGPVPPNPSELLLTSRMSVFIEEARKVYDYVVIDTPPLAIVTDAFVLSQYADHTLFLVRQNYTPKDLLRTVQDFFATGKLKNISVVLNDIYRSGPGYGYGYGYGYAYGYGYGYSYSLKKRKNGDGYYQE